MKLIELYRFRKPCGIFAIVDDEDFEWLNQWQWNARINPYTTYVVRKYNVSGKTVEISMHREIMGLPRNPGRNRGEITPNHLNHNGLDNRRANLKLVNAGIQTHDRRVWGHSQYRGVYWNKQIQKWHARVWTGEYHAGPSGVRCRKAKHLGYFASEIDAAHAYNVAALAFYGPDAKLNVIEEDESTEQSKAGQ